MLAGGSCVDRKLVDALIPEECIDLIALYRAMPMGADAALIH